MLPHRDRLERAFGESLADVEVHTGAGRALEAIGADAATLGSQIAFADAAPDLRTTAHEVAHVLQNRRADGPVAAGIGPANGPAELDAQRAASAVVGGGPAAVRAAPGGAVQLNPVKDAYQRMKARRQRPVAQAPQEPFKLSGGGGPGWQMGDRDVSATVAPVRGAGGSANRVDRITYEHGIGTSGERLGFFKPLGREGTGYTPELANKAIAATRLDHLLGFDMLPTEYMASHGGETGSVSPRVPGSALHEQRFDEVVDTKGVDATTWMQGAIPGFKQVGDEVRKNSGADIAWHDFTNPVTQRGLSDLQLFDALLGQIDRHGGNIYIDDTTGRVRGIDNDQILMKGWTDVKESFNHYVGLPALVSEGTAARILAVQPDTLLTALAREMRWAGADGLKPSDEKALLVRLATVKAHLTELQRQHKLIPDDAWGDDTYAAAMAEQGIAMGTKGGTPLIAERNYVKRSVELYNEAARGEGQNTAMPDPNARPAEQPFRQKRQFGPLPTAQGLLRRRGMAGAG